MNRILMSMLKHRIYFPLKLLMCSLGLSANHLVPDKTVTFKNAKVIFKDDQITVSTGKIERIWKWTGRGLQTVSIKNQHSGKEYGKIESKYLCDWDLPGAINDSSKADIVDVSVTENGDEGFSNKHLQVITTIKYPEAKLEIQHVKWVYSDASGIRNQLCVKAVEGYSPTGLPDKEGKRIDCGHWIAVPSARTEYLPLDFKVENAHRCCGLFGCGKRY